MYELGGFLSAAAVGTASAVLAGALVACADGPDGVPEPPGWNLTFADGFYGPAGSLPAPTRWRFGIGHSYPGGPENWGTGEVTYYTDDPANVSLDGTGNLRITPLRDYAGTWTSARIETHRQDFRPPPGGALRVEARLRLPEVTGPAALGYWSAFWALGSPYRDGTQEYPGLGEIDIMENVNGLDRVWGTLHCDAEPDGACGGPDGLAGHLPCPDLPCPGAFHTYRFEWDERVDPPELRWYVDYEQFHTVSQAEVPPEKWAGFTGHTGYFLLLNLAIGGGFPDAVAAETGVLSPPATTPTADTEPGHPLLVDYVAVWTSDG